MSDELPTEPESAPGLQGLDPGELLARGLHTVKRTDGSGPWEPPTPEDLAKLLPQYLIESLLGRGGMGAVYKGVQAALDRSVAIKLLPSELASDADFLARFQREARTLAKLQHSGIVTVYDFGQTSAGHLYFVMEYVDGTDLQRILKSPGLKPEQAFELIAQICDALYYAHRQGVIHRDIKPANILLTKDGRAKVADFGLARPLTDDSGGLTVTNMVMGTPDYMAPETRTSATHGDHRADIFALGVMLYEMLTGQRPHGAFQPPSHRVQVDVRIDEVVLKALQQEPDRRYQQASEMKVDVDRIRTTTPTPVKPKRSRLLIGVLVSVGALFALLAIFIAVNILSYGPASPTNTETAPEKVPSASATPPPVAASPTILANSLGMKFVPVPITGGPTNGQRVLFSIWPTRVQDYEIFARETRRDFWKPSFPQGPTHPVVNTSWEDAQAFCRWLTDRERKAGLIGADQAYRLPSDHEWSCGVGIGERENAAQSPAEKAGQIADAFPWGLAWPPPDNTGNFASEELVQLLKTTNVTNVHDFLPGYRDGHAVTAPVGSYAANRFGLYDMGGNAWQWCEDWFDSTQQGRARRGSCWNNGSRRTLLSAERQPSKPDARFTGFGFRVVLAPAAAAVASPSSAAANSSTGWTDALALVDPISHAQMRSGWARTASGIEWRSGPKGAQDFVAGTILVPLDLPPSYVVESEFMCGDADGTYGIFVPVGGDRMVTAWIDGYHFAGFGKVDDKSPEQNGEPGKASPFTLQANRRYTLRVEVRRAADAVDLQFRIDGQLVGQFHGVKDRLSVSTRWWTGPNRTQLMLGANRPGTFHSLKIKALDEAKAADSTTGSQATPATATKDAQFINTLGMKFVPVPIAGGPTAGQRVLFSVWDTRVQDYAAYVAANPKTDDGWKTRNFNGVPVGVQPDHPVVGVNWEEAQAFCQWLTAREIAAGKLAPGQKYRLPSDEEWSWAVGLPAEHDATPEEKGKRGANDLVFPWGKEWPPAMKVGNFADETWHARFPPTPRGDGVMLNGEWLRGYDDGYPTTSPVGSFPANRHGLYDLTGNVQQWCEDWCDAAHRGRVLRGSSYYNSSRSVLSSTFRHPPVPPQNRGPYFGFRCVLAPAGVAGPATSTTNPG